MEPDTDLVPKFGLMGQNTKGSGDSTKRMGKVSSGMQMATSMKGFGRMTKQTDMEFMFMLMAPNMKDTGRMICRTAKVLSHGAMEVGTKVVTKRA